MSHTLPVLERICGWCHRYSIKKRQVDRLFGHLCALYPYIRFTMESPGNNGSIPFLDISLFPMKITWYRHQYTGNKPTNTYWFLDWDSDHSIFAKKSVVYVLMYRAKNVCSTSKLLTKEMDYLHYVPLKYNHPEWMTKEPEKKPSTPIINPETDLEFKWSVFFLWLCPWFQWRVQKDLPLDWCTGIPQRQEYSQVQYQFTPMAKFHYIVSKM